MRAVRPDDQDDHRRSCGNDFACRLLTKLAPASFSRATNRYQSRDIEGDHRKIAKSERVV
jgi:hypothetical protein